MQRICSRNRPDDERQYYQPNMQCLFSIKTVRVIRVFIIYFCKRSKHIFLTKINMRLTFKSRRAKACNGLKKTKNKTSSLTIANNLKLQIKRQQMDYGNTQRCDLLYTPGITAASCGGEIADTLSLSPLLRVWFPELTVVFQEHMLPHSTFW